MLEIREPADPGRNLVQMVWKLLFFTLVAGYCLYYAPYGVNETDGGFLTGLAWQLLQGKHLYLDLVYVRPPLPVWLRALELRLLPEHWAILGERWIFYGKVALYSWLSASLLAQGERRWMLAVFGFVVSAHAYPAMSWHTVDGILFSVLSIYFLAKGTKSGWIAAGFCSFAAVLCKQSFYPLLPLLLLYLMSGKEDRLKKSAWFFGSFILTAACFVAYLKTSGTLAGFFQMTSGAASGGQALEHGLMDYFRITPELAIPSILLLIPVIGWFWKGGNPFLARLAWGGWLLSLVLSYAIITWLRQDHTVPFAQSRALFWVALFLFGAGLSKPLVESRLEPALTHPLILLGISWCASVSWGYNLPILFATPWVWGAMVMSRQLAFPTLHRRIGSIGLLLALLIAFRIGYEFIYRDGRRSDMKEQMGSIFPALSGIYSDPETAALYRELRQLADRYGPDFKTLPAFPQANFLTHTTPPLPLDWVVNRETNGKNELIYHQLTKPHLYFFIQKAFREKIETDPELEISRQVLEQGKIIEETPHFYVITLDKEQ